MSTRCLTMFLEESFDETEFALMYRHCDGYPEGHGKELREFLDSIPKNLEMCQVAALVVQRFAGAYPEGQGAMIYPVGERPGDIEFSYWVRPKKDGSYDILQVAGRAPDRIPIDKVKE